jgi:hypothetical protein
MEDRNYPVARPCPHCGNVAAKLMPPLGDYSEYICPNCGTYCISGTMERHIEIGTADPKPARIEERNGRRCLVS